MAGIVATIGVMLVLGGGHRGDRVFAFLSPEADPLGLGFQIRQLLIALGSGGIEGLGLGVSRQKFGYIPAAHTDGIFAIIGEEAGFIGCIVVIMLFAYLYTAVSASPSTPGTISASSWRWASSAGSPFRR